MDKNGTRFRKWHLPLLVLLVIGSVYAIRNNTKGAATKAAYISDEGVAFGTVYHVKYLHDEDLHPEIESVLCGVDSSLSMFNPQSVLSRINRNETDSVDGKLSEVLRLSMEASLYLASADAVGSHASILDMAQHLGIGTGLDGIMQVVAFVL